MQYKLQRYRKAMASVADIESSREISPRPRNTNIFPILHPFLLCSPSLPISSILGSGRRSGGGISAAKVSKERLRSLSFSIFPVKLEYNLPFRSHCNRPGPAGLQAPPRGEEVGQRREGTQNCHRNHLPPYPPPHREKYL